MSRRESINAPDPAAMVIILATLAGMKNEVIAMAKGVVARMTRIDDTTNP